jgi:hypothetical protein
MLQLLLPIINKRKLSLLFNPTSTLNITGLFIVEKKLEKKVKLPERGIEPQISV